MTTVNQKSREMYFLQRFRQLAPSFPAGPISQPQPPAPDALIHGTSGDTGIEITEYSWDEGSSRGSASAAQFDLQQRITADCEILWTGRKLPSVGVSVTWKTHAPEASKRDIAAHALALVDFVTRNTPDSERSSTLIDAPHPSWRELPPGVDYINVQRLPEGWQTYWAPTGGGGVPSIENAAAYLQHVVSAKEGRISEYRRFCKDLWLLVVVEGSHIGSYLALEEHSEAPAVHSSFDKVFLLTLIQQRLLQFPILNGASLQPNPSLQQVGPKTPRR